MDEIKHELDGKIGTFFWESNGKKLAIMNYRMADQAMMIVEHTEVDHSLKGQGIGKKLVQSLVEYVRKNDIKVRATCSFVNAMLHRNPQWQDILR